MSKKYAYLGSAIAYPPRLENGRLAIVSGLDVIKASLLQIFTTPKGTRFMLGEYGSDMEEGLFELGDGILQGLLRHYIKDAFVWEKRAKFKNVTFESSDEGVILCNVEYEILAVNEVDSFVFPYYTKLVH